MSSKNQSSADNQQERLSWWIVGFVDGEGTFSVSINKNSTTSSGWQIFPEFVVTQGAKSKFSLEEIQKFFQCGNIYINRRQDNHKENLFRFCVRSQSDLRERIIPFFLEHPLKTAKKEDFNKFVEILRLMERKKHLNKDGLQEISKIAARMNRKSSRWKSSETRRQVLPNSTKLSEVEKI